MLNKLHFKDRYRFIDKFFFKVNMKIHFYSFLIELFMSLNFSIQIQVK